MAWSGLCTLATWAICRLHPYRVIRDQSDWFQSPCIDAWVCLQAACLYLPVVLIYAFTQRFRQPWIGYALSMLMWLLPAVALVNAVIVGWIGRRLFSYDTMIQFVSHGPALVAHIPRGAIRLAILGGIGLAVFALLGGWSARKVASLWQRHASQWRCRSVVAGFVGVCVFGSAPVFWWPEQLLDQMRAAHTRHPWTVLGIVSPDPPVFLSRRQAELENTSVEQSPTALNQESPRGLAAQMRARMKLKDDRLAALHVESVAVRSPDVLIVIVESMRRELVDRNTMPNLWAFAEKGLHCKNHFSGGNATTHGMFSLFNGIDALWYSFSVRRDPLLPRLFREAGYETGFFAGHDDWGAFKMDGFVNENVFDEFRVTARDWLVTDRIAAERASTFLGKERTLRKPRLAVLYLYSTHADYRSYATDQVFQPAARDGYLIPYSQDSRDQVWNRYRNSARSIDRLLAGLLSNDRITVVTGDHGESFLEDQVCGHGTKLNQFQNMTPALVFAPGLNGNVVDRPTSHADLLPTMLDAAKIRVSDPNVMDGNSLLRQLPRDRIVFTRNYLDHEVWLIGDALSGAAMRFDIRPDEWSARYLKPQTWTTDSVADQSKPDEVLENDETRSFKSILHRWTEDRLPSRVAR